jgi:Cys-rich four helix bundle protein (predicted Tat secretion target)
MDRRKLLGVLGVATAASALPALGQHDHHMQGMVRQALIDSAGACTVAAEACLTHCVDLMAAGDKSLQACTVCSREVLAVCSALRSLAAQNSPHLAALAMVSAEVCKSCVAECNKHAQHVACKTCADACAACATECAKTAA